MCFGRFNRRSVVVGGREWFQTAVKASSRAMKDVWYVLSIDYKFSMNNIIVVNN